MDFSRRNVKRIMCNRTACMADLHLQISFLNVYETIKDALQGRLWPVLQVNV